MKPNLKGGRFLASGVDTCVYLDPPVECIPGTLLAGKDYDPTDKTLVSRITADTGRENQEFVVQVAVREAVKRIDVEFAGSNFGKCFQIAVAQCTPVIRSVDLVGGPCPVLKSAALNSLGTKNEFINFLTKRQINDFQEERGNFLRQKEPEVLLSAFYKLITATCALNCEGVVHLDAHGGNVAWISETELVLSDWGTGVESYNAFLECWLFNSYKYRERDLLNYSQFNSQLRFLNKMLPRGSSLRDYIRFNLRETDLTSLQKLYMSWDVISLYTLLMSYLKSLRIYINQIFYEEMEDLIFKKDVDTMPHFRLLVWTLLAKNFQKINEDWRDQRLQNVAVIRPPQKRRRGAD